MKKKVFAFLLAAATAVSMLGGCSGKTGSAYEPVLPDKEEEAEIFVEKIDGIPDDFIRGMDVSMTLAEEESGVVYYNKDGEETDLFKILADAGVNYIRVRVWNDPFDADGNGYGGGNCTVETAAEIGKRAAEYGMKLNVDFHYSDFWADPRKWFAPKAWDGKTLEEKQELLYEFTKDSLNTIIKAGADVGMVQIGNEINNGIAGESNIYDKISLLKEGSRAVREVAKKKKQDIKVVVHFAQITEKNNIMSIAETLEEEGLDYDVFGVSFYPFWDGTIENMQEVLSGIKENYGKETCVLETSYAYTLQDGDAAGNSFSDGNEMEEYPVSPQGQANCIRDVMAGAYEAGALGIFYWEGAWIPVGDDFESNQKLWEKYGSGWASSYAAEYDPDDAGVNYGGSSWDNQAFFDFEGNPLPSLDVFKYVKYGAKAKELQIIKLEDMTMQVPVGAEFTLPETVEAIYNDTSCQDPAAVTWNEEQAAAVDTSEVGNFTVKGTSADGHEMTLLVLVREQAAE